MTRRAEKGAGTQGATAEARSLATLLAPLVAGMTTTRQQLLAWVQAAGLVALDAVFREEAASLAGPKGRHDPTRSHHHWGTIPRQLTFGGRRLSVACPRVRSRAGDGACRQTRETARASCAPSPEDAGRLADAVRGRRASVARHAWRGRRGLRG